MSGWYQKIARDIGQIPNAVAYYEQELDQAKYEVKIKGNLEKIQPQCLVLLNKGSTNYKK